MSSPFLLILLPLRLVVVIVIREFCVRHMSRNPHVSTITINRGSSLGLILDFLQNCTSPESPHAWALELGAPLKETPRRKIVYVVTYYGFRTLSVSRFFYFPSFGSHSEFKQFPRNPHLKIISYTCLNYISTFVPTEQKYIDLVRISPFCCVQSRRNERLAIIRKQYFCVSWDN
jgi:hypothetical protein